MALTDKLTAIGNAIREKTGGTELLTLDAMPNEIASITTGGGGIPEEAFIISGSCGYRFANGGWDWFLEEYSNQITTSNITDANYMFYKGGSADMLLNLKINGSLDLGCGNIDSMFANTYFTDLSNVEVNDFVGVGTIITVFNGSTALIHMPKFNNLLISDSGFVNAGGQVFANCPRLREIDEGFLAGYYSKRFGLYTYSSPYNMLFYSCNSLDEINGLVPITYTWTSNMFSSTFKDCRRLKNFTFALQDDGTPYTVEWANQTINLADGNIGYSQYTDLKNYGFTTDTQITDATTYEALKNNVDSWTKAIEYSRYNHDSAVATINSLPDTSAFLATNGGTNTITFTGASGSSTDGGAINTLTEEEIAVATAKGWTVSLT